MSARRWNRGLHAGRGPGGGVEGEREPGTAERALDRARPLTKSGRAYPGGTPAGVESTVPTRPGTARSVGVALLALALAAGLTGCLWEPQIEDQWTRVDIESASVVHLQPVPTGSTLTLGGRANVTYRRILTGVVVAELRASTAVPGAAAIVRPDAEREPMAAAIDRILGSSVSLGRDARLVTGWDHLIQPFDFSFSGSVPAAFDSTGAPIGLFLLCYLGSGTEVELPDGSDSLVVTPFNSTQYQVLPVGLALTVTP